MTDTSELLVGGVNYNFEDTTARGGLADLTTVVNGKEPALNKGESKDLNTATSTGIYSFGANATNTPCTYGLCFTMAGQWGYRIQIAGQINADKLFFRRSDNSGSSWSAWKGIV